MMTLLQGSIHTGLHLLWGEVHLSLLLLLIFALLLLLLPLPLPLLLLLMLMLEWLLRCSMLLLQLIQSLLHQRLEDANKISSFSTQNS